MEIKSLELKESSVDIDARTVSGYASTWEMDQTRDIIHRGAFAKSISERFKANKIKILWQHDLPLGMPVEMREDDYGLFVKSRISKTSLGDEALELMRDGVVDRMSIGFSIPAGKADYDEEEQVRHIREVKLFEASYVTFPANEGAIVTGVKQIQRAIENGVDIKDASELLTAIRQLETALKSLQHEPEQPRDPLAEFKAMLQSLQK